MLFQSQRRAAYRDALEQLAAQGLSYRCTCSRQSQESSPLSIYNGHCRHLQQDEDKVAAVRLDINRALQVLGLKPLLAFDDLCQGQQQQHLLSEVGDFVIHRKDGLFAYQLAVVVDDIFQGITHVIRGADLLDSTARQILLFKLLSPATRSSPVPVFGHVPLLLNHEGQKLSKQNFAAPLDDQTPTLNLFAALQFLHQHPPTKLATETPATVLDWAVAHWKIGALC